MLESENLNHDSDTTDITAKSESENTESEAMEPVLSPSELAEQSMERHPSYKWYVLQVVTGHEQKVTHLIHERLAVTGQEHKVGIVLSPAEEIIEKKAGKSRKVNKKFFPGYVLVHADLDDDLWHAVRQVPSTLKFVGGARNKPHAISKFEVKKILDRLGSKEKSGIKTNILFDPGESVKVTDGPFADFNGVVEEVNQEKGKLIVSVLIFGRSTPVELEFNQVEKTI